MTEPEHIYVKPGLLPGVDPAKATPDDLLKIRDEYTKQVIPPMGAWVKLTRMVRRRLAAKDLVKADAPAPAEESPAAPAAEGSEESPSAEVATTEEAPADVSPAPSEAVSADAEGTDVRRRRRREGEG